MGKIAKNTESRYFSELDSLGNKLIDIEGMTKRKDVWTSPESLKRIGEKDNILYIYAQVTETRTDPK